MSGTPPVSLIVSCTVFCSSMSSVTIVMMSRFMPLKSSDMASATGVARVGSAFNALRGIWSHNNCNVPHVSIKRRGVPISSSASISAESAIIRPSSPGAEHSGSSI